VSDSGNWDALAVDQVADLLAAFDGPWWVAGGVAIDLFVGQATRSHHDVDVAVLRDHWPSLEALLTGWDFRIGTNEVWARRGPDQPWLVEFVLEERSGVDWVYRRDPEVTMPLANFGRITADGIPYELPEVVLLYKSKYADETNNTADFEAARPKLGIGARCWLAGALEVVQPDHPWLGQLL